MQEDNEINDIDELKQIKDNIEELRNNYKESREVVNQFRKNGNEESALKEEENAEKFLIEIDELKKKRDELQEKVNQAEAKIAENSEQNENNANVVLEASSNATTPTNENKKERTIKSVLKKIQTFFASKWNGIKKKILKLNKAEDAKLLPEKSEKTVEQSKLQDQVNTNIVAEVFKSRIKVDNEIKQTDQTDIKKAKECDSDNLIKVDNCAGEVIL